LALAALAFVGGHFVLSSHAIRGRLMARLGELGFRALYSVVALGAFFWLVKAYGAAPVVEVWAEPAGGRFVVAFLMLLATILVVLGMVSPNPTLAGAEGMAAGADPTRSIMAITRHPMLWGFALWAVAHLVVNGDAAAIMLFGALGVLAFGGMAHIDARKRATGSADWVAFEAATSAVPFAALLAGRVTLRVRSLLDWRFALSLAVYAGLLALHETVIGRSPFAP
jgi:uncharacterized membrane protein